MTSTKFTCVACKRFIISVGGPPGLTLCATCANYPGWFMDDEVRKIFDPDWHANPQELEPDEPPIVVIPPEDFINFELYLNGCGHFTIGQLCSIEELRAAAASGGERAMWLLATERAKTFRQCADE